MNYKNAVAVLVLGGLLVGSAVRAQTTNLPPTTIELVESQTDAVIIKGFGPAGSVPLGQGTVTVGVKETTNLVMNHKWYGLVLEYTDNERRERAVLDYEEIEPLLKGMDYIGTISYNVTTLPGFEAIFQTKAGFRVIGLGGQRQSTLQTFLQFDGFPKISLQVSQVSQLRNVIEQALNILNGLKSPK